MKKIGIIVIIMSVIVSLSLLKKKPEEEIVKKPSKEQIILEQNKEKYSKHIRFYNRILNIDKGLLYYFEDAGMDKKFKNIQNEEVVADIAIDKNFIDKLKELSESNEKKDDMDKKAEAIIPILEKMLPITDKMRTYYKNKEYTKDNYAKAQILHTELLACMDKYNQVTESYKEVFQKKSDEIKKLMIKDYDKRKQYITYNQFMFIEEGDQIIKEIHKQGLDASDFTTKGNAKKFKKLEEKMDKAFIKFEKSIKNTKQLGKEGYNPGDHSEFIQKANKFKQSVNVFIQRIEKKEKASHSSVSDSFFAQTEEGTPENVLANFNEVIKEHNKLLAKKTKK
ncbi:YiiG family protein [Leptotrichia sp. oral taxon 879]|uniref:YiiG family protein n=1 Tax=Leptotrichia sp. oral taxon 879 TaxID=1227267 RepID=UPI0003FCAF9F|nr:YiiG family protein [Leptotrichia sp. oral taxon 879]